MAYRRRGERQGSKWQAASKDDEKPSTRSQPCRQFLRGNCHYGATCRFSHDKSVALDRRPETGANEASEAREAYFDFKRRLKQINSSLFLGAHAPLANVWRQALTILQGGAREWQMSIARDLANENVGGPEAISKTLRACLDDRADSQFGISELFLQVITHDLLLDCLSLESYVGTIYRMIAGVNGEQAIQFFTSLSRRLAQNPTCPQAPAVFNLQVSALYEVLRRERRSLLNDELPGLLDAFKDVTKTLTNNAPGCSILESVPARLTLMRRMSGMERSRILAPLDDTMAVPVVSTATVRSTFPLQMKIPGGNHDNDFTDISKIQIFPTLDEVMRTRTKPDFLPSTDFTQPHFLGDPVQRHIDAAFRLLRHDIFGPLKDVVGNLLAEDNLDPNRTSHSIGGSTRVHSYARASVADMHVSPRFGLEAVLSFEAPVQLRGKSSSDQRRWWQDSSRLDEGGLVSFVSVRNGARSLLLFVVTDKSALDEKRSENRSSRLTDHPGPSITVKLASDTASEVLRLNQIYVNKEQGILVELPGLIPETFVPILRNLKVMMGDGALAFQKWILPPNDEDRDKTRAGTIPPPVYARRRGFKFRLDSICPKKSAGLTLDPAFPENTDLDALRRATGFDQGQCHGFVAALTREYALLQGPPGTGKSFVGVKLVKVLLDHKEKERLGPIFVICYTNHALDQFLKHLLHEGIEKVIRIGGQSREESLAGKNLRVVSKTEAKTSVEKQILAAAYREMEECFESADDTLRPIRLVRKKPLDWDIVQPFLSRTYPDIAQQFKLDHEDGGFTRVGSDPLKQWLGKRRTGQARAIDALQREAEREIYSLHPCERWVLADRWCQEIVLESSDSMVERLEHAENARKQISDVHADLDRRALAKADVIGVTTTGLARNINTLRHLRSKVIVCEEAAEILEPHLLNLLMPGVEHFIQVGDHRQLRPQIQNYLKFSLETYEGQAYQLDRSQFERRAVGEPGFEPLDVATLGVQRRMRPEISSLITNIYPDLKDHDTVHGLPDVVGMRDNLFWWDHSHHEDSRDDGSRVKSHSNSGEVAMAAALVRHLVRQGRYSNSDIALLTPYTGQLQKLRAALSKDFEVFLSERDLESLAQDGFEEAGPRKGLEKKKLSQAIRISTCDNFQGEESKIVIVSLVRSNERAKVGFLKTENRINVLLSRAQHGMYLIGNVKTYLGANIPMWTQVHQKLAAAERIGERLGLCCPRHPKTPILCRGPFDFDKFSPEGGCSLTCDRRLNRCGHRCPAPCHADALHQVFNCLQPCPRLRTTCRHACPKLCGERCGDCLFKLNSVKLPCGHTVDGVPCYRTLDLKGVHCSHPVEKTIPGCGHNLTLDCSVKVESGFFKCPVQCAAVLPCGHACVGTCGTCRCKMDDQEGVILLHQKCVKKCGRPRQTCTHTCESICHDGTPCGSCTLQCEVRCSHSRCAQACHEPCSPCIEKCTWSCEHQGSCSLPCAAPCNRLPCDLRCQLRLTKCGHQCPSYCGEECPQDMCQICCKESLKEAVVDMLEFRAYSEVDLDLSPIVVLGCGHAFTGETVDGILGLSEVYTTDAKGAYKGLQELSGELAAKVPSCPSCRIPIRQFSTKRYNRVVNRAVMDETLKRFLVHGRRRLQDLSSRVDSASQSLTRSRDRFLAGKPLTTGDKALHPLLSKTRHSDMNELEQEATKLARDMEAEHQPSKKLYGAIVTFQRRQAQLQFQPTIEQQMANLDIAESFPPQPVYNQQVTLEASLLQLRIQEATLVDVYTLFRSEKGATGTKTSSIIPTKRTADFLRSCRELIARSSDAKLPRLVIQATLYYARIVRLESWHRRACVPPKVVPAPVPQRQSQKPKEPVAEESRHDAAKELLGQALELCKSFGGGADFLPEVERLARLFRGPWYEEVTPKELEMIKTAMVSGRAGIATHSGHWYNCENGHPFAIGECGMPMEEARCPECGARIGGQNHQAVAGVTRATSMER
ncbi:hypothetical protein QBC42DRAFT_293724 [Cladorrhinum samala]|uniref:NFX1-type zinc finger-containing protein 1 n=1 Tax=Cladorrhinum samala TaxID=585594 RepID=A0AAV9HZC6_9PEZI|nr:hypothetical protein QBC42DRAFT_293724 [Cladorrhinum samala]